MSILMVPELTAEQRALMNERGFCVLEDLFTVEEMEELTRLIEAHQQRHADRLVANGGTEGISRASEILFTHDLAEQDAGIRAFATRPEFVAISTQLLGPDTDLYWNQSVFKEPEGEKEFPWHQDDGYTPVEPSPYVTVWLALNDATIENGCIWTLPGSHKQGLVEHTKSPIGLVCYPSDAPDQGVPVPIRAGSVAIFWSLTMHKSGVNRSQGKRKAYILQYSHANLKNLRTGEILSHKIPVARNGQPAQ